jgi:hypothetical protein
MILKYFLIKVVHVKTMVRLFRKKSTSMPWGKWAFFKIKHYLVIEIKDNP